MSLILEESETTKSDLGNDRIIGGMIWRFALFTSFLAILCLSYAWESSSKIQYELAELTVVDSTALDMAFSFDFL